MIYDFIAGSKRTGFEAPPGGLEWAGIGMNGLESDLKRKDQDNEPPLHTSLRQGFGPADEPQIVSQDGQSHPGGRATLMS